MYVSAIYSQLGENLRHLQKSRITDIILEVSGGENNKGEGCPPTPPKYTPVKRRRKQQQQQQQQYIKKKKHLRVEYHPARAKK